MTTTAVVGLGIMGSAIARHLLDAGCAVLGYDVDAARLRELEDRGGTALGSAREAAERADEGSEERARAEREVKRYEAFLAVGGS